MPADRSSSQNRKFHALCSDVARQASFNGRRLSTQQWKVLFVSAWVIASGDDPDLVRGLEGEFVLLRESTARMGVARMADLIEYCHAWCALNNIELSK